MIDSAMGTKEIKCFTQNQSGLGHKPIPPPHFAYANCSATRQRFLIHRFVQFASRNAQGPAVCPSGQTRHDGQNIGEMSFPVSAFRVSYQVTQTPSFDSPDGPEFKNKRSTLDVKAPAHTDMSLPVAQTHRLLAQPVQYCTVCLLPLANDTR